MPPAVPTPVRLHLFYEGFEHLASHSGYERIAGALAPHAEVTIWRPPSRTFLPHALSEALVRRAGTPLYRERSLQYELAIARRLCFGRGTICHLLYALSIQHLAHLPAAVRRSDSRLVGTYHLPGWWHERDFLPDPRVLEVPDALIAVSSGLADWLRSRVSHDRVYFIHHGVDTAYYRPSLSGERDPLHAICVGSHLRDFAMLEQVIRQATGRDPRLRFTVVSVAPAAQALGHLPRTSIVTGLSDAQLVRLYQTAGVMILPLSDMTASNSLLEAIACAVPVVITDVSGVRDYVDDRCAVIVAAGNCVDMCQALLELVADYDRREALGRAARRRALELDWAHVAQSHLQVYRGLK